MNYDILVVGFYKKQGKSMAFVKRKNLTGREEFLYVPVLHWMYVVKHLILFFLMLAGAATAWFILKFRIEIVFALIIFFLIQIVFIIFIYRSVEYGVTNKRLMIKRGIFTTRTVEIFIDRIESINCRQPLFGKFFNYGNIIVNGIGCKSMVFYMVRKPYALRRKVVEIIEKSKAVTVIHGKIPNYERPKRPVIDDTYLWGTFVECRK